MKHLYKIILICGLLIIKSVGYVQGTSLTSGPPTYKINEGTSIVLHGNTNSAVVAYQWYKDGVPIPGAINKDYTANQGGIYTVVAFNKEGCPSTVSEGVVVLVVPRLPVKPDTSVDLMITIQSSNTQATIGDNYNYILTADNNSQPDGTQVKVTYVLPPEITYVPQAATNVTYNSASRTLTWTIDRIAQHKAVNLTLKVQVLKAGKIVSSVDIKGKQFDPVLANNVDKVVQQVNPLIIPNVFTPNGDGVNDTFFIPGLETYEATEIVIINRWGNDVYEKKNYKNDWTGNGLVEGTYFYILRAKNLAGVWDIYKGYVTLLRSKLK
jgi:gliding motility-associated-like protein/uncharacterized repeat protein (TIGR01451 family)